MTDESKVTVQDAQFTQLTAKGGAGGSGSIDMLMDLELPISVELGRVRMLVKDILELGPGAVVELNKFSGEPVDLFINNRKFAEGEVVVVDQNFGVRITALVGPNERLSQIK
jgi:flagellar motor switch protein FliN/FliY